PFKGHNRRAAAEIAVAVRRGEWVRERLSESAPTFGRPVVGSQVLMMRRPAGRFLTIPFPPFPFAARLLAAVILPPRLFLAMLAGPLGNQSRSAVPGIASTMSGAPSPRNPRVETRHLREERARPDLQRTGPLHAYPARFPGRRGQSSQVLE